MNILLSSALEGLFGTIALFIISCILVVGSKVIFLKLKSILPKKQPPLEPVTPAKQTVKKPRKKPATIRSIEIDPAEIDRIYVKKIS